MENTENKTVVVNTHFEKCDVYIGRPSKWGNPFFVGKDGTRDEVIQKYNEYIVTNKELLDCLHELKGKRLGCFCKPADCHGDILAELANKLDEK